MLKAPLCTHNACKGYVFQSRGGVDGLWDGDSFSADSNSDPSTVRQSAAAAACDELLQECLRRGSCDNMSVVVILF